MIDNTGSLFTVSSLGTFAGASAAVAVLGNTFRKLTGINRAWPPFVCAVLVSGFVAYESKAFDNQVQGAMIVLLNSCLLFLTALGMQEAAISLQPTPGGPKPFGKGPTKFWSHWLH